MCSRPGGCEGAPECLDDEGGPLAAEDHDGNENLEDWVCGPCQREKHARCRSPECCCCAADPEGIPRG